MRSVFPFVAAPKNWGSSLITSQQRTNECSKKVKEVGRASGYPFTVVVFHLW